jgi:hypothetical protein
MNPQTQAQTNAIEFDAIEFTETPTTVVVEAIREYEESQADLKTEDGSSADSTWSFLAHQVVGHEVGD